MEEHFKFLFIVKIEKLNKFKAGKATKEQTNKKKKPQTTNSGVCVCLCVCVCGSTHQIGGLKNVYSLKN